MKPSVARRPLPAVLFAASALLATPSLAQSPPEAGRTAGEPAPGRYQFQPVEGGLARLDTATGEITICRIDPARMACDMGAGASAIQPRPSAEASPILPRPSAEAVDEAEFERALGRMKRVFRTFGDIAREFETQAPPATAEPDRT